MKAREPRKTVLIKARLRDGATWRDAMILNLSSRGLMIRAEQPPANGSYLELRRGRHVIVARVMWRRDGLCGLRAQDRLPTEAIIAEPDASAAGPLVPGIERRVAPAAKTPRLASHEESRWRARAFEYAGLAVIGLSCAGLAYGAVSHALGAPLAVVENALAAKRVSAP